MRVRMCEIPGKRLTYIRIEIDSWYYLIGNHHLTSFLTKKNFSIDKVAYAEMRKFPDGPVQFWILGKCPYSGHP